MTIDELLVDFDEMGFIPTTLCENPDEYAREWKKQLLAENERLTEERNRYAENLAKYQMASDKEIIAQKEEAEKRFENNMRAVLKIEKKQAVKEFAEKLKKIVFEQGNPYNVPYEEFSQANVLFMVIDELLKEYIDEE